MQVRTGVDFDNQSTFVNHIDAGLVDHQKVRLVKSVKKIPHQPCDGARMNQCCRDAASLSVCDTARNRSGPLSEAGQPQLDAQTPACEDCDAYFSRENNDQKYNNLWKILLTQPSALRKRNSRL